MSTKTRTWLPRPKMTIQTRMSLWFTTVLAAMCVLLLVVTALAFGEYGRQAARVELLEAVWNEASSIEGDRDYARQLVDGGLADAEFTRGNVQLMVYGEEGEHYAGLFLYDELDELPPSSADDLRTTELDGITYYYYDEHVRVPHGKDCWVRGIVRAEASMWDMLGRSNFLLWATPLLVLVAFFGGRLLAGWLLAPIRQIDHVTREIRESGDLSRRVPVSNAGDELAALASSTNDMLQTLERNFEAERAFASSASHELRTPIAIILAQCEYAEENASDERELRESIAAVRRQGTKMSGIVESLLMLTRMEQGTDRYARESLDLSSLVRSVCVDFVNAYEDVCVECDVRDGIVVEANRGLVELALNNLLSNARKYGGDGVGICVSLVRTSGKARIAVQDDGPGVAASERERIWDVFYRGDRSCGSAGAGPEGVGLGLPLVRRIAEYHGGSANIEDTESGGSLFVIELPL